MKAYSQPLRKKHKIVESYDPKGNFLIELWFEWENALKNLEK